MSTITEIVSSAMRLDPEEFLELRIALDQLEEKLWNRKLGRVSAKNRKQKLTDAKIDKLVLGRRYRGRQP
jgi:hypothetical protein